MDQNAGPLESLKKDIDIVGRQVERKPEVPTVEELMRQVNQAGDVVRNLIVQIKRLPVDRENGLEPHQEASRALAISQSYLQTGFMWLRRAIETPKTF